MTGGDSIGRVLDRFAARRSRARGLAAVLFGVAAVALWTLAAALTDRWAAWPGPVRWATFGLGAAGATWTLVAATLRFFRREDRLTAAGRIEAAEGDWAERLVTVVWQAGLPAERRGSAALNDTLAAAASARLAERPPVVRRPWRALAALAAVAGLWAALWPVPGLELGRLAARQVRPWADLPPVTGTRIELMPHRRPVVAGEPLTVSATIGGLLAPATLWAGPDAAHLTGVPMLAKPGGPASATLPGVRGDFVYRVTAGDAVSPLVVVTVRRRPGVDGLSVRLDYPASAGRPPVTRGPTDGRFRVPTGTRLTVRLTATEPLARCRVYVGDHAVDAEAVGDGAWQASWVAEQSAPWSIQLTAVNGLHGGGPPDMRVDVEGAATRPATRLGG